VKAYADFSALKTLPAAGVTTSMTVTRRGAEEDARVTLRNPGRTLAFFVRLQIAKHTTGEEVLPVLWEDNYISLWPGETRVLKATYNVKDLGAARPKLVVSGWNVPAGAAMLRVRNIP
jgi:exo-1,4-beta-D-glucosaminidase